MIHIHTGGGGFASGLSRKYPNSLNHTDWKAPLRCGILFCTFSCVLFVIGVILTWLGIRRSVHDVFGETVPITGPILLAVGGLMLLLAIRQFYLAHVRKKTNIKTIPGQEQGQGQAVITAMTDHEEDQEFSESSNLNKKKYHDGGEYHDDDAHGEIGEKSPLNSGAYYDQNIASASCNEPLIGGGGYVWPQVPVQSPYYSMAMMVYKDPTLTYGPFVSAPPLPTETCTAGPAVANGSDMALCGEEQCPLSPGGKSLPAQRSIDTAVLETTSTTLHQPLAASLSGNCQTGVTVASSGQQDCVRIFPSDYLSQYQRSSGVNPSSATAGINSLPSSTAFMMIRTLELQETI